MSSSLVKQVSKRSYFYNQLHGHQVWTLTFSINWEQNHQASLATPKEMLLASPEHKAFDRTSYEERLDQ